MKASSSSAQTYKEWRNKKNMLTEIAGRLKIKTTEADLTSLLNGNWSRDELKISGAHRLVRKLANQREWAKICGNILNKWKSQSMKEDPTRVAKRGFQIACRGKVRYDIWEPYLGIDGYLGDGRHFNVIFKKEVTITNIGEQLKKQVGILPKNIRLEIERTLIEKSNKLKEYKINDGDCFVLFRNDE